MKLPVIVACAALCLLAASPAPVVAADAPASWDGLVRVDAKKLRFVYLAPGADFSGYTRVQLDPTEVAFRKNWLRDHNRSATGLAGRISEAEALRGMELARTTFEEIFNEAYASSGFQLATAPGPDVLRVRTAIVDLHVAAPDTQSTGSRQDLQP